MNRGVNYTNKSSSTNKTGICIVVIPECIITSDKVL